MSRGTLLHCCIFDDEANIIQAKFKTPEIANEFKWVVEESTKKAKESKEVDIVDECAKGIEHVAVKEPKEVDIISECMKGIERVAVKELKEVDIEKCAKEIGRVTVKELTRLKEYANTSCGSVEHASDGCIGCEDDECEVQFRLALGRDSLNFHVETISYCRS